MSAEDPARTYRISEAAAASGLTIKAIRYYERIGLIPPPRRTDGGVYPATGQRLFSPGDIGRLRFIHRARLLGLKLAEIRELLAAAEGHCPGSLPRYREVLRHHLARIEAQMRHLETLRGHVRLLLRRAPRPVRECFDTDCNCLETGQGGKTGDEPSQEVKS